MDVACLMYIIKHCVDHYVWLINPICALHLFHCYIRTGLSGKNDVDVALKIKYKYLNSRTSDTDVLNAVMSVFCYFVLKYSCFDNSREYSRLFSFRFCDALERRV